jgi:antitoxin (DNA-binding transcriptional repressor) of toxin-antitoxin stability system
MKTLTITDAKKNLSKWLQAAARGEEVAIVSGADIIALRKVPVQAADYAWTEYGASAEEISCFEEMAIAQHDELRKAGKLNYLTTENLRSMRQKREKTSRR